MKSTISFQHTVKMLHGVPAVCIDDLQIYETECVAFYGLKEETIEIITHQMMGASYPDQGTVCVNGKNSREIPDAMWFDHIGHFGIYNPATRFHEKSSVGENIARLLRCHSPGIAEPQLSAAVLRIANLVQLTITDLSRTIGDAGSVLRMKARLAKTLATRPQWVLFYEPTADLSHGVTRKFVELIRRTHRKFHFTCILFTSDVRLLQELADRVLFLNPVTGALVENQLRGWYHNVLPFLQPSSSKLLQLARDILQHGGLTTEKVNG